MAIPQDFKTLAARVLPARMRSLQRSMMKTMRMADFAVSGNGVRTLLNAHGHAADFSGCYVLIARRPIYVGISRRVFARLRQHVTGTTHFDASLAYRMAAHTKPHQLSRGDAMKDRTFFKVFEVKRAYLRRLRVATLAIEDPVELYLFEVYAALTLGTTKWNTFRTH
jgi:hypothetical protein